MIKNKKIGIAFSVILTLVILSWLIFPTSIDLIREEIRKDGFNILLEKDVELELGIIIISSVTVMFLVITFVICLKPKKEEKYLRNIEEVIEPVLAETIIDGKIDTKNLIMTVLTEQIYKRRITIEGNKLLLVNCFDMNEYEREVLNLIFYGSGDSVEMNNLDRKYIKEGKENIIYTYKKVKQMIIEKLLKLNIYKQNNIINKIMEIVIKIFILFTTLYISIPRLPWAKGYNAIAVNIYTICIGTIIIQLMVIFICFFCNIGKKERKSISGLGITLVPLSILETFSIVSNILNNRWGYILNLSIVIINIIICICIIRRLKRNKLFLTDKGREEYKKIKSLKNYIMDYSLMKDRSIENVALWDEYLVYAVAFGIPNKITEKFSVRLVDITIDLEKADRMLNFIF